MNIFHGPLKIFSHLSLAWPSDAMISKQSADSQKINAAKYYKRGEGGDHRTVCWSTAKKEKMTPSDHTHSHTQRTFCVDFIDRFVEKAEINTYFPAECWNQNLVQKKNWEIWTSWWLKYTRGKVVPAELQSKVWFLQKSTWNKSHFNN